MKNTLKKINSKIKNIFFSNNNKIDYSLQFNSLYQKFSMDDFYLENHMIDKSMDLFCICNKINLKM